MKLRDNFLILGGVLVAGFITHRLFYNYISNRAEQKTTKDYIDNNPWLMQTSALDAYQYYSVSDTAARFVYGPEKELSYVSTEMLQNAIDNLHDQILQEVQQLYMDQPHVNMESYFSNNDYGNPYWAEINRAANNAAPTP